MTEAAKTKDAVHVGLDTGCRSYCVDQEKIDTFNRGLNVDNPIYSRQSPFGDPVAPSLIRHSEVYENGNWYLPNMHGFLHARQEFELYAPIFAGEHVTTHTFVAERYAKRDRDYVVCESLVIGSDGRVCVKGRTHQSFLKPEAPAMSGEVRGSSRANRTFSVGSEPALETLPGLSRTVGPEMCMNFSGPGKNLHNDEEQARLLGFPTVIVQGMLSICLLSEQLTMRFGAGWLQGGRLAVSLVNPVWMGEEITTHARVIRETPEGARQRKELEVWCQKPDGTVVITGTAQAVE